MSFYDSVRKNVKKDFEDEDKEKNNENEPKEEESKMAAFEELKKKSEDSGEEKKDANKTKEGEELDTDIEILRTEGENESSGGTRKKEKRSLGDKSKGEKTGNKKELVKHLKNLENQNKEILNLLRAIKKNTDRI